MLAGADGASLILPAPNSPAWEWNKCWEAPEHGASHTGDKRPRDHIWDNPHQTVEAFS